MRRRISVRKKPAKGQDDEQDAIFHRPLGLQIDIDRIDEIDAQRFAAVRLERRVKIARQMRDFPLRFEAFAADSAGLRQKTATEIRVWPVRFQMDVVGLTDRGKGEARRAGQLQRKAEVEAAGLLQVDRPEIGGQPAQAVFACRFRRGKTVGLAIDRDARVVADAARIADTQLQGEADIAHRLAAKQFSQRANGKIATAVGRQAKQPRLVNAALARLDTRLAIQIQLGRRQ